MQKPQPVALGGDVAGGAAFGAVVIGYRPTIRPFDDADPVGPQKMQLSQPPAHRQRLDIGVSGEHEVAIKRLKKIRPAHMGARF